MASSFGVLGLLRSTRRVPQCPGTEFSKPARHSGFSGSDREPLTKHVDRERLSKSGPRMCPRPPLGPCLCYSCHICSSLRGVLGTQAPSDRDSEGVVLTPTLRVTQCYPLGKPFPNDHSRARPCVRLQHSNARPGIVYVYVLSILYLIYFVSAYLSMYLPVIHLFLFIHREREAYTHREVFFQGAAG